MKKAISFLITAIMIISVFSACSDNSSTQESNDKKISIVTTNFPEYDWVREMMGEKSANADITMLLDNGVDLHSYQPSADDIRKISECDMFVYVGGESDEWAEDALAEATNKDMKVVNLLEVLGDAVKTEETVEGMQESEHEHDEDAEEATLEEEHDEEADEHVWLSLRNAQILCSAIAENLSAIDPDNSETYAKNKDDYIKKLASLDTKYEEAVKNANQKTLLFADRFPFRYMVDDYGLEYFAAFVGCSAETEASFETITFLANKADEKNLSTILTIESSDGKIAKTVIDNTKKKDQKILVMDSLQSFTSGDAENGVTYISVMEKNLDVLKEALK